MQKAIEPKIAGNDRLRSHRSVNHFVNQFTLGSMIEAFTTGTKATRKHAAMRLFFLGFILSSLTTSTLLVWKEIAGVVPDVVFNIAYGLVLVGVLVGIVAGTLFYVAHFSRDTDAT
jgi:hypothetical protein